jgi:hypothetical protein
MRHDRFLRAQLSALSKDLPCLLYMSGQHAAVENINILECIELQREEIQVLEVRHICLCANSATQASSRLQSIYPYFISTSDEPSKGIVKLEIPIELGGSVSVHIIDDGTTSTNASASQAAPVMLTLSSLPPVLLEIILPPTYPVFDAPFINSTHVVDNWLPSHLSLRQRLQEQFQSGEGALYNWVEWIRSADFLREFGFLTGKVGEEIIRRVVDSVHNECMLKRLQPSPPTAPSIIS